MEFLIDHILQFHSKEIQLLMKVHCSNRLIMIKLIKITHIIHIKDNQKILMSKITKILFKNNKIKI
jgi:hypothetical protein